MEYFIYYSYIVGVFSHAIMFNCVYLTCPFVRVPHPVLMGLIWPISVPLYVILLILSGAE